MNIKTFVPLFLLTLFTSYSSIGQDLGPSTHYGNGTTYHSRANIGKQGIVTTTGSKGETSTVIDCARFPEICRELLEEAGDAENPDPGEGDPGEGGSQPDGGGETPDPDEEEKDKKESNSTMSLNDLTENEMQSIKEYKAMYKTRRGVWQKDKKGKWIFIKRHKKHTAFLISSIRATSRK